MTDRFVQLAYYTKQQIAEELQTSVRFVDRLIKNGKLKAHHFGRLVRISAENFQAYKDRSKN